MRCTKCLPIVSRVQEEFNKSIFEWMAVWFLTQRPLPSRNGFSLILDPPKLHFHTHTHCLLFKVINDSSSFMPAGEARHVAFQHSPQSFSCWTWMEALLSSPGPQSEQETCQTQGVERWYNTWPWSCSRIQPTIQGCDDSPFSHFLRPTHLPLVAFSNLSIRRCPC